MIETAMTTMPSHIEVAKLKHEYVEAFVAWLDVPDRLILARPHSSDRKDVRAYLAMRWRKLRLDLLAGLSLIHGHHIGAASILSRVCRENAMTMLALALDEPANDIENLKVLTVNVREERAKRLIKDASALHRTKLAIQPHVRQRLQEAVACAQGLLKECRVTGRGASPLEGLGFRKIIERTAGQLVDLGIDASGLATQIVDYWMECEAVHSGPDAMHLYVLHPRVNGETELCGEIDSLSRLRDLYSVKAIVTAALVHAFDLLGRFVIPAESKRLAEIASKAEQLVVEYNNDRLANSD